VQTRLDARYMNRFHQQMPYIQAVGQLGKWLPKGPAQKLIHNGSQSILARPDYPAQGQRPGNPTATQIESSSHCGNVPCPTLGIRIYGEDYSGQHGKTQNPEHQSQPLGQACLPYILVVQKVTKKQSNQPGSGSGMGGVVDEAHLGAVTTKVSMMEVIFISYHI